MEDAAEVKALLGTKLSEQQLRKFRYDDYVQLASAGFCDLESFEAATSVLLMEALPRRSGLVAVLLKAFAAADTSKESIKVPKTIGQEALSAKWTDAAKISKLEELFLKDLLDCRRRSDTPDPRRLGKEKLPLKGGLISDFGDYFTLKGREETVHHLILSAARIFATFENQEATVDSFHRKDFIMMIVGYPGVGKTTIGTCLSELLTDEWLARKTDPHFRNSLVEEVGELTANKFTKMMDNVVESGYELRMYHSVETQGLEGGLLEQESGLSYKQILALRCLHAAVNRLSIPSYSNMLDKLETQAPGLKNALDFGDVIKFIRQGLKIPDGRKIFLSWFFDEANRAATTYTWLQHILSEIVSWFTDNRGGDTFPIFTVATTSASISINRAQSVYIPVRPLEAQECEEVAHVFFNRVLDYVEPGATFKMTHEWRKIIRLAGGNPRMLSFLLNGLVSASPAQVDVRVLAAELQKGLTAEKVFHTLENSWQLFSSQYFQGYQLSEKAPLLLKAMYVSLLGKPVTRDELVWEERYSDRWGDLEGQGLVGLIQIERPVRPPRKVRKPSSTATPSSLLFRPSFSPMVAYLLINGMYVPGLFSDLWSFFTSYYYKGLSDVLGIAFMIRLKVYLHGESEGFTLDEIIPWDTDLPNKLLELRFHLPQQDVDWNPVPMCSRPKEFILKIDPTAIIVQILKFKDRYAPLFLKLKLRNRNFYIFVESEYQRIANKRSASLEAIASEASHNMRDWGIDPSDTLTLYWPDENPENARTCNKDALDSRLIIGGKSSEDGPFELLSAVSHLLECARLKCGH